VSAETVVYVRVLKMHEEWVEVQAVTLSDAITQASLLPDVAKVMEATYARRGETENTVR
jgi:hypothetical protein